MTRTVFSRRGFTLSAVAGLGVTAACGNGIGSTGGPEIDARVDTTLNEMYNQFPNTRALADKANGILVMPLVTNVGLGFGGAYGRGALRVDDATVDYYSLTEVSGGLQIGAQQYAHVLFFMTEDALMKFRTSPGWVVGGNVTYVISEVGDSVATSTTTALAPVQAVVFGRAGLFLGATLDGNKYTRIIP